MEDRTEYPINASEVGKHLHGIADNLKITLNKDIERWTIPSLLPSIPPLLTPKQDFNKILSFLENYISSSQTLNKENDLKKNPALGTSAGKELNTPVSNHGRELAETLESKSQTLTEKTAEQNKPRTPDRKPDVVGTVRENYYTRMLKQWQPDDFYSKLNQRIFECQSCAKNKIGFIPSYGMGYVRAVETDMLKFRPDLFVIADPPLNFFIKGNLPPSAKFTMTSGSLSEISDNAKFQNFVGNRQAWLAADRVEQNYNKYLIEAPVLFWKALYGNHFQMERVLISSLARCFVSKEAYKKYFSEGEKKGPACAPWILEELKFLLENSKPQMILLLSTHFARIFMNRSESIQELREMEDLNWQSIPVRVTYHPYQWLMDSSGKFEQAAMDDLRKIRNRL